jgi:hypothetical protein
MLQAQEFYVQIGRPTDCPAASKFFDQSGSVSQTDAQGIPNLCTLIKVSSTASPIMPASERPRAGGAALDCEIAADRCDEAEQRTCILISNSARLV